MAARRVALVIGSAGLGGAEGQLVRLAVELEKRGDEVFVLFMNSGGPLTNVLEEAGVSFKVARPLWPPTSIGRNLVGIASLAWQLGRFRPQIVHSWLAGSIWIALPVAAMFTRAKRIAAFRGEVHESTIRRVQRPFRHAVRRAHAVTVNSPSLVAEAIRWGADPEKIHFIANGVEMPSERCAPLVHPPTAVVVANFRYYKGHDVLLSAVAKLQNPVRIRLCGDGQDRLAFADEVKAAGLQHVITLVPEPADIAAELRAAQFAIHPSRMEGMSNAILEEISFGLPVVATDVGGIRLQVEDNVSGILVSAGDAEGLASAIDKMSGDPDLREGMSEEARKVSRTFSWPKCASLYDELFATILATP